MASRDTARRWGILDLRQQQSQALAGLQRGRAVARLIGGHGVRPQQLGAGLRVKGVGGGQELTDPAASQAQDVVGQHPEVQQVAEQVR